MKLATLYILQEREGHTLHIVGAFSALHKAEKYAAFLARTTGREITITETEKLDNQVGLKAEVRQYHTCTVYGIRANYVNLPVYISSCAEKLSDRDTIVENYPCSSHDKRLARCYALADLQRARGLAEQAWSNYVEIKFN